MKYSIIVPVYNIEQYVGQCLDSLIHQTYSDLQIIVVNDGSTDDSHKILEEYVCDNRVQILKKENGGLSSARNMGLEYVLGDYVMFVDGDDWLELNTIEIVNKTLEERSDIDILTFSYYHAYEDLSKKVVSYEYPSGSVVDGEAFLKQSQFRLIACSKVYKTSFLNETSIMFLKGRLHEDISFTIPLMLLAKRVVNVDVPLYNYRQGRVGSIMANIQEKNVDDFINAYCFVYKFAMERGVLDDFVKRYLKWVFFHSCHTSFVSFCVLAKYMELNDVPNIVSQINNQQLTRGRKFLFYVHLLITHLNHRVRHIITKTLRIKRPIR